MDLSKVKNKKKIKKKRKREERKEERYPDGLSPGEISALRRSNQCTERYLKSRGTADGPPGCITTVSLDDGDCIRLALRKMIINI